MNDRFKVRAWHSGIKEMFHFDSAMLIIDNPERYGLFLPVTEGKLAMSASGYTFMQCTGLKDDEETPIFEGDILECTCPEGTIVAVVEYGNPNSAYWWGLQLRKLKGDDFNMDILLWVETELPQMECRIIGNIYENQNMLTG